MLPQPPSSPAPSVARIPAPLALPLPCPFGRRGEPSSLAVTGCAASSGLRLLQLPRPHRSVPAPSVLSRPRGLRAKTGKQKAHGGPFVSLSALGSGTTERDGASRRSSTLQPTCRASLASQRVQQPSNRPAEAPLAAAETRCATTRTASEEGTETLIAKTKTGNAKATTKTKATTTKTKATTTMMKATTTKMKATTTKVKATTTKVKARNPQRRGAHALCVETQRDPRLVRTSRRRWVKWRSVRWCLSHALRLDEILEACFPSLLLQRFSRLPRTAPSELTRSAPSRFRRSPAPRLPRLFGVPAVDRRALSLFSRRSPSQQALCVSLRPSAALPVRPRRDTTSAQKTKLSTGCRARGPAGCQRAA